MYNPKSLKAEEFISDEEIRETLAYADANKENMELIDQILAKAKECKGLTHREASVLLACPIPEKIQDMYDLAAEIKKEFYGNRIVLFAPLYLSNYCVNGCVYCPYHKKNQHIARKKLTQEAGSTPHHLYLSMCLFHHKYRQYQYNPCNGHPLTYKQQLFLPADL